MSNTVGFIGLGNMGGPMALNLVKHGFSLVVHDIDRGKAEVWKTRGATLATSAEAVAAKVARTICMVETTTQAESFFSGELSIIVGGAATTVAACQDLFRAMGANVFHVGALGQGLAMKLVNNMLVQINTVAVAEALVLGVKAGLDPKTIYDVVRVSTGNSFAFETRVPKMLKRDFSPGGTVDIAL